MKKLLLASVAAVTLSTSAFADMIDYQLYLRADAITSKFVIASTGGNRYKSRISPALDLGVGYNFIDNMRAELVYMHNFPAMFKSKSGGSLKAKVDAAMARLAIDVVDLDLAKIFIGAGVGIAKVSHSINSTKSGGKINPAYNILAGTSFGLNDRTNLEIGYVFADYGRTKGLKGLNVGAVNLRSHNIFAGIRWEL